MFSLKGRTVLVTGASRGIGASAARLAARAGARVIAHASAQSEAGEAVAAEIGAPFLFEDLSRPGAGPRLVARAIDRAPALDCIVNNAGLYRATPIAGGALDALWESGWEETIAVNLRAPADICRAAIAHFRGIGGGRVVNVASRAGERGDSLDYAAYAASKGGLIALTKTYARALSGENILFYALAPGWVETRMAPEDVEARRRAVADIPLGRVAAPEEIGNLIVFLLADGCPSATGATFDANGASYVR